jgi:Sigma-70 region 2
MPLINLQSLTLVAFGTAFSFINIIIIKKNAHVLTVRLLYLMSCNNINFMGRLQMTDIDAFFHKHYPDIYRLAVSFLKNSEDAADMIQDAYILTLTL